MRAKHCRSWTNESAPLWYLQAPYSYQNYQCLYFTAAKQSFLAAKEECEEYGGFLPQTFTGFSGMTLQVRVQFTVQTTASANS